MGATETGTPPGVSSPEARCPICGRCCEVWKGVAPLVREGSVMAFRRREFRRVPRPQELSRGE
jgi:hypothetical protein